MSRVDPPGRKWSVLVVDDDPALRGLFTSILTREGFSFDWAANGRVAHEYLRQGSYSVLLLDLMMPDVNGFELLARIGRESPALLRRVIVMTGAAQRVAESVDRRRVWGVIRKPFDNSELIATLRDCAAGRRTTPSAETAGLHQRAVH